MTRSLSIALIAVLAAATTGCQSPSLARVLGAPGLTRDDVEDVVAPAHFTPNSRKPSPEAEPLIQQTSYQADAAVDAGAAAKVEPTLAESHTASSPLALSDVLVSVTNTFPLVHAAALQFDVAQGQLQSAEGAFDLKLKAASENGPLGFYQTYRHSAGAVQPMMFVGEVFGGYRIGRGDFQPWYQERQTNDGGEFKAGLAVPLSRNVDIDDRRAGLRKAEIDISAADPQYRGAVIDTIQSASHAYWSWVAAGARQQIAAQVLELATTRNEGLKEKIDAGSASTAMLKDNRRSILSREAKLIDAGRKLEQSAAKLSIYLRTPTGEPITPMESQLPTFPTIEAPADANRSRLTQVALQTRPELRELELAIDRVDVEIAQSENDLQPNVDAVLVGGQDVGEPTSRKRDKSPFELEAAVHFNVPLQRRKARGKLTSLEAKRSQIAHKQRLTVDKVRTEIDIAFAALTAAYERVQRTAEARELARFMVGVETDKLEAGASNLLSVALREEQAADAAGTEVDANLEYQLALAALRAAAGIDDGTIIDWVP